MLLHPIFTELHVQVSEGSGGIPKAISRKLPQGMVFPSALHPACMQAYRACAL